MHRKSMEVAQSLEPGNVSSGHLDASLYNEYKKDLTASSGIGGGNNNKSGGSNNLGIVEDEDFRSHSIATLRAKAHEHSVKLMAGTAARDLLSSVGSGEEHSEEIVAKEAMK